MLKPIPAPSHPDAAARWLADRLARTATSPLEELLTPQAVSDKSWLKVRQRIENELAEYVVRVPR